MNVAVWDTYVKTPKGSFLHFDIIVPDTQKDSAVIYGYGRDYLAATGGPPADFSTEECRLCHIESPTEEMLQSIGEKGYYILEMEEIPAALPAHPTRRDMILHLRAHAVQYRFANFRGISDEQLKAMVQEHEVLDR